MKLRQFTRKFAPQGYYFVRTIARIEDEPIKLFKSDIVEKQEMYVLNTRPYIYAETEPEIMDKIDIFANNKHAKCTIYRFFEKRY